MLHYRIKQFKKERDFLFRKVELFTINSKKLTFPDFMIIGAQKAGTTWLHHNLNKHEEVFFPKLKGVHDPSELKYFELKLKHSIKWYSNLFAGAGNKNKIKGEKSPGYYFLPKSRIKMIRQ